MPLSQLDHVTIRCSDLARSRAFYSEALGLVDGERPAIPIPGAWLWLNGRAVVHLIGEQNPSARGTGCFDHVAFAASDLESTRERLRKSGIAFREGAIPGFPLHQIFLTDPDGVTIELNIALA